MQTSTVVEGEISIVSGQVKLVELRGCRFLAADAACAFFSETMRTATEIVLYKTNVDATAMRTMFETVEETQKLKILTILGWGDLLPDGTYQMMDNELCVLAEFLPRCSCIKSISIGNIANFCVSSMQAFAESLQFSGVVDIRLADTWDKFGMVSLAAAAAPYMVCIELCEVEMEQDVFDAFSGLLCNNKTIEIIRVTRCRFKDVTSMIPFIRQSTSIRELRLDYNSISLTESFADALTANNSLSYISFSHVRRINDDWASYMLRTTLQSHISLNRICLTGTSVSFPLRDKINDRLEWLDSNHVAVMVALVSSKVRRLGSASVMGKLFQCEMFRKIEEFLYVPVQ